MYYKILESIFIKGRR